MKALIQLWRFWVGETAVAAGWPRSFVFFKWLLVCFAFSFTYEAAIHYFNIPLLESAFEGEMKLSLIFTVISTVLIAPPLEELIFRLPLRQNRFHGWSVFLLILIAVIFWGKPWFFYPIILYILLLVVYQNYSPANKVLFPVIVVSSIIFLVPCT